ncbi:MAG: hypothetical protein AAF975_08690, partial [Spirochaetota bacterium]
ALAIYQKQIDDRPLSIHLRQGLDMFFQLSGSERPLNPLENFIEGGGVAKAQNTWEPSIARETLGGGLFLSSTLTQLSQPELYWESLEGLERLENRPSRIKVPGLPDNPYLSPLLLYPTIFEIQAGTQADAAPVQQNAANDPLLQNLSPSQVSRLIDNEWLKEQLLQPENDKNYVYLQTPRRVLLDYLYGSLSSWHFGLNRFSPENTSLEAFQEAYRGLLAKAETLGSDAPPKQEPQEPREPLPNFKDAGLEFTRLQQKLYPDAAGNPRLSYRDLATKIEPASYPYLYFKGRLQGSLHTALTLQLQLEQVLWAGLSKGLSRSHRQQALDLLDWLQSLEGQQILQQKLPPLDRNHSLGIFRGLSIYPQMNRGFWESLQLDWPERFHILWQLPNTFVQWEPELFEQMSLEQELLLREHSAITVIYSFLIPYLFLPENRLPHSVQNSAAGW